MDKEYEADSNYEVEDFSQNPLPKGDYENCRFIGCTFSNTDLSGFHFIDCSFRDCDFSMAKIVSTVFRDVRFKACKLLGLKFDQCNKLLLSVEFENCQLNLASFFQLNLKNTVIADCNLQEVDFTEADMTGSTIRNCDLGGTIFEQTILKKADLRGSYHLSIDPEINRIEKAKFSFPQLPGLLNKYKIEID